MPAKKPKSFKHFETEMSAPPTPLHKLHPTQRETLLRSLFNLAKTKTSLETWKIFAEEGVPEGRKRSEQFESMKVHLAHPLKEIQQARESLGELIDDFLPEDFDFDEIVARIGYGLQTAETWKRLCAASIHPGLRTDKESTIAIKTGEYEGKAEGNYPVKVVYALDHWFIGESERLLDKFKTAKGTKLRTIDYDRIISRAFSAAFGDFSYTESRVKTARPRIRRRLKHLYVEPFSNAPHRH
jgi:hypothetical protein